MENNSSIADELRSLGESATFILAHERATTYDDSFYGHQEEQMKKWIKSNGFDGTINEFW